MLLNISAGRICLFSYFSLPSDVMTILRFHWLRFIGAIVTLILALLYLFGFEKPAMAGFIVIGAYATFLGIRIQRGKQRAVCDLCGAKSMMKVEYEPGFSNVRLIIDCPRCGRVVNKAKRGIRPGRESDR